MKFLSYPAEAPNSTCDNFNCLRRLLTASPRAMEGDKPFGVLFAGSIDAYDVQTDARSKSPVYSGRLAPQVA